ncbi:FHA domain-containing protein [Stomatohabitans albus]|uniref:FHA domain-containing protein n=1 Tax=Stomatohabitans albus TaxID=3110766 RepID=UPI00300C3C9D
MSTVALLGLRVLFVLGLYGFILWCVRWIATDVRRAGEQPGASTGVDASRHAGAKRPRELVVHYASGAPEKFALSRGLELTFGRASQADVVIKDPYVSSSHARVAESGGDWVLYDLGAANGTFLNGQRITQPTPLRAGDQIRIGSATVEVRR